MARRKTEWADSPAAVTQRRTMDVTLPSGLRFTLRTVHLDELAVAEALPGDLYAAAILDAADLLLPQMLQEIRDGKPEEAEKLSRDALLLRDRVCKAAIVKPEPTDNVMGALDGFDKAMIAELAQRKRSTDAAGKVVAAQALGDFSQFREVGDGGTGSPSGDEDGEVAEPVG